MNAKDSLPSNTGKQSLGLLGWILFCFLASGTAIFVSTGGWYAQLHKPSWNPPSWVFGPAWTLLYVMMAVAAWLIWCDGGWKAQWRPLILFLFQWLLNALWTPLFFGLHLTGLAFAEIVALWFVLAATLRSFWYVRKAAAILLMPYLLWITFAASLNFAIWRLNL